MGNNIHMKRIITGLATLTTILTLSVAPAFLATSTAEAASAASASRGTPGCITKAEFRRVTKKTTIKRARRIIGAKGRLTSSDSYSDGDASRAYDFRQCGQRWSMSSISLSFEKTERRVWVSDWYCYDGYCEDWGGYETKYSKPFILTSKYAYWF